MANALQDAEMPDLKAIICAFTRRVGGADGVARMLMREYRDAKPGSMIRSMILQMILQGSKVISAKEKGKEGLDMVSDEDVNKEIDRLIEAAKTANGRRS